MKFGKRFLIKLAIWFIAMTLFTGLHESCKWSENIYFIGFLIITLGIIFYKRGRYKNKQFEADNTELINETTDKNNNTELISDSIEEGKKKRTVADALFGTKTEKGILSSSKYYQEQKRLKEEKEKQELESTAHILAMGIRDNTLNIDVPIRLMKNESAYYSVLNTQWYETRKERTSVSYGHLKQRFKITKGLSYTIGNVKPKVHSEDRLQLIATGNLYVTNKSIMLVGSHGVKKIDINKIVDIDLYSDALYLARNTGKPVFLEMPKKDILLIKVILDNMD